MMSSLSRTQWWLYTIARWQSAQNETISMPNLFAPIAGGSTLCLTMSPSRHRLRPSSSARCVDAGSSSWSQSRLRHTWSTTGTTSQPMVFLNATAALKHSLAKNSSINTPFSATLLKASWGTTRCITLTHLELEPLFIMATIIRGPMLPPRRTCHLMMATPHTKIPFTTACMAPTCDPITATTCLRSLAISAPSAWGSSCTWVLTVTMSTMHMASQDFSQWRSRWSLAILARWPDVDVTLWQRTCIGHTWNVTRPARASDQLHALNVAEPFRSSSRSISILCRLTVTSVQRRLQNSSSSMPSVPSVWASSETRKFFAITWGDTRTIKARSFTMQMYWPQPLRSCSHPISRFNKCSRVDHRFSSLHQPIRSKPTRLSSSKNVGPLEKETFGLQCNSNTCCFVRQSLQN